MLKVSPLENEKRAQCGQLKGVQFQSLWWMGVDAEILIFGWLVGCSATLYPPKLKMVPPKNDGCQSRGISPIPFKVPFSCEPWKKLWEGTQALKVTKSPRENSFQAPKRKLIGIPFPSNLHLRVLLGSARVP